MNDAFEDALRLHEAGNLAEAARLLADIVRSNPRHFGALYRLGAIQFQIGRFAEAEHLFAAAAKIDANVAEASFSRGCALQNLERHEDALLAFARALVIRPEYLEARNNRGASLLALGRHEEALAAFDKVLAARPNEAFVHGNRAAALSGLKRYREALVAAEESVRRSPDDPSAWCQRGVALAGLARADDAARAFDKAIALKPDYPDALHFRGLVSAMLGRHEEALAFYDRAIPIAPGNADLINHRANALLNLRRFEDAIAECERILQLDPGYKFVSGNRLHAKLQICDWQSLDAERAAISAAVMAGARVLQPLQDVLISHSEAEQLQCAKTWVASECPPTAPLWRGERYRHERIRVAYVSANLRDHAVAQAMAGVFEHHDRSRFEITAISLGHPEKSEMRDRLMRSFDRFVEASGRSDTEIATLLRELEIGIAVDLMGHTEDARPSIFAARPAPVQVNFLGFPASMGAPYFDYIIADAIVVPKDRWAHYSEHPVHLPDSYMPSDSSRKPTSDTPTRAEAGLPETGFIFASFNTVAKFNPEMFDIWMRLLHATDGSVLWMSSVGPAAQRNLRREAEARGVAGERIVAAPFVEDSAAHLARLSLADLFLDTLPYNAHAGGVDALKAGVPILTCTGSTFAGRVGTSLLSAAGLPELAVSSLAEYEALALAFARDGERLASVKTKLSANRATHPLFDTVRYTRHLEAAFARMWQRHQQGQAPAGFTVAAS
jgi:predicted O-linked N-acetylglucosamine transferase (SPINDLY family)